jgi:hypothetical protein
MFMRNIRKKAYPRSFLCFILFLLKIEDFCKKSFLESLEFRKFPLHFFKTIKILTICMKMKLHVRTISSSDSLDITEFIISTKYIQYFPLD